MKTTEKDACKLPYINNKIIISCALAVVVAGLTWVQASLPDGTPPASASVDEKLTAAWAKIEETQYSESELPTKAPGIFDLGKLLCSKFLRVAFLNESDEMPLSRKRIIHTYGSVAKIKYLPSDFNHPFTGIFQSGGTGLIRLSLAGQIGAYTPSGAFKIYIDGKPSINFHTIYSVEGQGEDKNFFRNRFSNVVPPPTTPAFKVIGRSFAKTIRGLAYPPENERTLPLEQAAAILPDGTELDAWNAPHEIQLIPGQEVANFIPSDDQVDFRVRLGSIPAGSELYHLVGRARDGEWHDVGSLILDSAFIASAYGDQTLFFQHQSRKAPKKIEK